MRFGRRDYDPDIGRFVAQDPAGDTGGDHDPYEYCVDDPVNAVDPRGLASVPFPFNLGVTNKAREYAGDYGYDVSQCSNDQLERIFEDIPQSEADAFKKSHDSLPEEGNVLTQEEREKVWKATEEQKDFLESWRSRFDSDGCVRKNE